MPTRLASLLVAAAVLCLPLSARADEGEDGDGEPARDLDERSITGEIWTAMGSSDAVSEGGFRDAEFIYVTGVLGVYRSAPFVGGLAVDFGGRDDDFHVLAGPVAGLGFDLVPGLRIEALLQIGAHFVDGIGYDYSFDEDGASGNESTWLMQGGLRIGLSGRIGRDSPRVVLGGWVAMFRDLTTTTETITYPEGGTEEWDVGGSIALLAVRLGLEW